MLLCGMNVIFWRGYVNPWLKFVSGEEEHLRSYGQPFVPILSGTEPDGPVGGPVAQGWGLLGAWWEDVWGDGCWCYWWYWCYRSYWQSQAAQAKTSILGHLLSASCASAWKGHLRVNLKAFMLLIDPTPNPVLFLSFLPDS